MPRIVYLQYTNPGGYPPLQHSAGLLAERGWAALFLGVYVSRDRSLSFPPRQGVRTWQLPYGGSGLAHQANYLVYVLWAALICAFFRPAFIYASDRLSALPALIARAVCGCKLIYHEHDAPEPVMNSRLRLIDRAYARLARNADLCIVPQEERLRRFVARTGRQGPVARVWNCPRREEAAAPPPARSGPVRFYFHGSLNPQMLPLSILEALAAASDRARLTIVGYETVGSAGYAAAFLQKAAELGLSERVDYAGAMPRPAMMAKAAACDVGFCFMPFVDRDANLAAMTGASNKVFDYMAKGLFTLVSDLPDWRAMFCEPGYARPCDPYDPHSLAAAMAWCADNPTAVRAAGEKARQRVLEDWNYETQFQPVIAFMEDRV